VSRARLDGRGLTLIETLLALTILAVIMVALAGTLRLGASAWEAGQREAQALQEARAVTDLLGEALAAAFPYRGRLGGGLERVILFQGEPGEIRFVTSAPPLVLDGPAAFHAVVVGRDEPDRLRVLERLLPSDEPFAPGAGEAALARAVSRVRFEYRDPAGTWVDRWDGPTAGRLPAAVRIDVTLRLRAGERTLPRLVVPLALGRGPA
jgi:prepilin-type N-terminal cleavage/methylation domain-containing protein